MSLICERFQRHNNLKQRNLEKKKILQAYPEIAKPLVVVDEHLEALVVDEREEAGVSQVVPGHRQLLQDHGHHLHPCGWKTHQCHHCTE